MGDSDRDDAPTTPPVAIRPDRSAGPVSGLRSEGLENEARDTDLTLEAPAPPQNPDTLMSLPKPAPHGELPFEVRLRQLEDRLETLESRVAQAERGHELGSAPRSTPWWFWLLFLLGLAFTWRVLDLLR
jgi:MYXO-CTERM domain-containing protein